MSDLFGFVPPAALPPPLREKFYTRWLRLESEFRACLFGSEADFAALDRWLVANTDTWPDTNVSWEKSHYTRESAERWSRRADAPFTWPRKLPRESVTDFLARAHDRFSVGAQRQEQGAAGGAGVTS